MQNFPNDWYWSASDGRIYSSARQATVTQSDSQYAAWRALGNKASVWPSDESGTQTLDALQDVLTAYGLFADLKGYAAARRYEREIGGITINGMSVATDRDSQGLISGAFSYVQVVPTAIIKYKAEGGFVPLNAQAISAVAVAVATHVQDCFSREADVCGRIDSGVITSLAQVDATFEA